MTTFAYLVKPRDFYGTDVDIILLCTHDTATPGVAGILYSGSGNLTNVAYASDGDIYLLGRYNRIKRIHSDLGQPTASFHEPVFYTFDERISEGGEDHLAWIRDIQVRRVGSRDVLFFSAYQSESSTGVYYLDDNKHPVLYHTIRGEELPISIPCGPDGESYWTQWDGVFAFDQSENLYVSHGSNNPAGLYRINGAGPGGVSGSVERIIELNSPITSLACGTDGSVYFRMSSGNIIYTVNFSTSEVVEAGTLPTSTLTGWEQERVIDFCLLPTSLTAKISWIKRSLQRLLRVDLPIEGIIDERTVIAIQLFQRRNGLTADGIAGPVTLSKLEEALADLE